MIVATIQEIEEYKNEALKIPNNEPIMIQSIADGEKCNILLSFGTKTLEEVIRNSINIIKRKYI
jgi:sialic acid synthase SpsE